MRDEIVSEQSHTPIPFYKFYLSMPPIGSPILASMLVNGVKFKPFEEHYNQSDYCQDVAQRVLDRQDTFGRYHPNMVCTYMDVNPEWWNDVFAEPMLGFAISASVISTFVVTSKYVLQDFDSYKYSSTVIDFAVNTANSILPKKDDVLNTLKFVALNGAISATYGLVGAACLQNLHDVKDVTNIATAQAVGGAVLPAIGVGLLWGYRAVKDSISVTQKNPTELNAPLLGEQREQLHFLQI